MHSAIEGDEHCGDWSECVHQAKMLETTGKPHCIRTHSELNPSEKTTEGA